MYIYMTFRISYNNIIQQHKIIFDLFVYEKYNEN